MDSRADIELLFRKYLENRCSPEEAETLLELLRNGNDAMEANRLVEEKLRASDKSLPEDSDLKERLEARLHTILSGEKKDTVRLKKRITIWQWAAAAVIVLAIGAGSIFLLQRNKQPLRQIVKAAPVSNDVLPGGNKAVLTLSNGNTVVLDSAHNGVLSNQGGSSVTNTTNGLLSYHTTADATEVAYNTLTTPNGGQYKLRLPDGTMVWLNDASSIRYPTAFNGSERLVEITGEAYFEVVHNAHQPFRVKAGGQLIEDVGTRFNVHAYTDENSIKTTLLEGAVNVRGGNGGGTPVLLQPGQQAILGKDEKIKVTMPEDAENVIAWKDGMFYFDNADIRSVMQQLAKWYDIQVQYEGAPSKRRFKGKVQRNIPLSVLLKNIGDNDIHYMIKDKTVTIYP